MKAVILSIFAILFISCGIVKESARRGFIEQEGIDSPLKLNGYYYRLKYPTPTYSSLDSTTDLFFFYKNGKSLELGSFQNGLFGTEERLRAQEWGIRIHKDDTLDPTGDIRWTNFSIKRDSIYIERIYPWQYYPHWISVGNIINDTTFVFDKNERCISHSS